MTTQSPRNDCSYFCQQLHKARQSLMLPHRDGEAESIARAYHELELGFTWFDRELITDDGPITWLREIDELMSLKGVQIPRDNKRSIYYYRAVQLSQDDQGRMSSLIEELANYFDRLDLRDRGWR